MKEECYNSRYLCNFQGFGIAVLDRGFVYVGNLSVSDEWCIITDAKNIRYWGTTEGLGELALNGPTSKTKLDNVGTVRAPKKALIHIIDSEATKWNKS
jgi:hypothetical protein